MSENDVANPSPEEDRELLQVVEEEERCLGRVVDHVRGLSPQREERRVIDYDRQLIDLRDQIAQARMEDVPPLLEQMERLQHLSARQGLSTVGHVDARSPYFGRMVLREQERTREVLIGRSTYLDTRAGVRIVDWRDAPVSRLYYRYAEGDDYEETFGDREVEGEVVTRRSVTIVDADLKRIVSPQGVFLRSREAGWKRGGASVRLKGGQGSALRAEQHHRPGKLGVGSDEAGEDRHLKAITALIDPRQFELITKPDSGLVVIQGGAGSGKTTIGLHRLAYLAFQDRRRFRPDRMLVIAFNQALVRYISKVLPALEVQGVGVRTFVEWVARLRASHFPRLTKLHAEDTPGVVSRFKKHPAMLRCIDDFAEGMAGEFEQAFTRAAGDESAARVRDRFRSTRNRPLRHRLHALGRWVRDGGVQGAPANTLRRELRRALERTDDVVGAWAEMVTDHGFLTASMQQHAAGEFSAAELRRVVDWCSARTSLVLAEAEREAESGGPPRREGSQRDGGRRGDRVERGGRGGSAARAEEAEEADAEEPARLDVEDDTLLLKFWQKLSGPLLRPGSKEALSYEHVLIDEAQDLSPVELSVLVSTVSGGQSITLAGDVAQRLYMDNGFTGWENLLGELSLSHVQVEPLQVTYRSTEQVMELAYGVLGPLATGDPPQATRRGAPVELFTFAHSGDAVGFLSEALRELSADEPQASIAVIARYPEQADVFYAGLKQAEIPNLRRIAEQDFPFKAGVDVTDLRQVKGLEFDYVVLVDVNLSSYPVDDESRHLLHIGATRAAHQLWLLATGKPSELLPDKLRRGDY